MTAETHDIKRDPHRDVPAVTIDRVETPPLDGPKPTPLIRWTALIGGILGMLCFLALPFLPVQQTQASLSWPQNNSMNSVDAPLMAQTPIDLDITIPLGLAEELDEDRNVLLSTIPPTAKNPTEKGMQIRSTDNGVDVIFRDQVLLSIDREIVEDNPGALLTVHSDANGTEAFVPDLTDREGEPLRGEEDDDIRPMVTGLYTYLPADGDAAAAQAAGLNVEMEIDSRFTSHPTVLKYIAIVVGLLSTIAALWALWRIDQVDGSTRRRWLPKNALKPTPLDLLVGGILVLWHFIGANTSDDGYIFSMARASQESGYMANYYRWFGAPESPFGSPYYDLIALMTHVSTASIWLRLPALAAGLATWFVISRLVIPRLGKTISQRKVAYWSAAGVLLAFWLPYNNGLRPEPVIAFGALMTWVFIERAILTRRLLPAAFGVIVATLALGSGPTGLMAVAALLAGLPSLVRIVVQRHQVLGGGFGAPAIQIAPFFAAGTAILIGVFGDQTLASVMESIRVRGVIGPSTPWYEEPIRYYWLFLQTVDGSLGRRFPVFIALTALVVVIASLLRYRTVPGALAGPATRLVFVYIGTMFFMTFTPTKWTHHFGVYAGITASLAALAAMAVSHWAVGSRRNQFLFAGAMIFIMAFALTGINGWWYVSAFGVPWFDKTIQYRGIEASGIVLALALIVLFAGAIFAFIENLRGKPAAPSNLAKRLKLGTLAASPIAVVSFAMVFFMVASLAKAAISQYPAYNVAAGNIRSLGGNTCNFATDILMETDANQGFLRPISGSFGSSLDPDDDARGFDPNGMPSDMVADAVWADEGQSNSTAVDDGATTNFVAGGSNAGTDGGFSGETGINGSRAELPYSLDTSRIPVLGSYSDSIQVPAATTTAWYQLPELNDDTPLIVVTAAGRIFHHDINGVKQEGQKLVAEYGRQEGNNFEVLAEVEPIDVGPAPTWRNLRFLTSDIPEGATAMRLVAEDTDLAEDAWLAFTPPRVAQLETLNDVIGSDTPTITDWPVSLQFPCQDIFSHYAGVAERPEYRIMPDRPLKVTGADTWQSSEGGGPLGWSDAMNASEAVPTYMKDDWARDWGSVESLRPRNNPDGVAPDYAELQLEETTRSGWWKPGRMYPEED